MNVIQFKARTRNTFNQSSNGPASNNVVTLPSSQDSTTTNDISAERRERLLAILLREAEQLDQA